MLRLSIVRCLLHWDYFWERKIINPTSQNYTVARVHPAMSEPNATAGSGGRGPAPPLPDKPPSVAERTRLLKSSFRKEVEDKPRVVQDNRTVTNSSPGGPPPPLAEKPNMGSQGVLSSGAERSPSPALGSSGPPGNKGGGGSGNVQVTSTTLTEKVVIYPQAPASTPLADQNGKAPVGRPFVNLV